ncbi:hypothetical protein SAMN05421803_14323 [Nocardiopsis flavescens]|uniref:Uncharacterized protein n=1 Tax=Nocardiopsis flavescens TaxID=758803 RepID=A0A1M6WG29_9ACTN|nr:hypothetical protein [Nocardiopsis flavescens]SHK92720.1 hypothetical protein SAMN05421803_14323 [Nocardiopsis flavescens]
MAPTEPVLSPLVQALAAVDLADEARPGGIAAGVDQAAGLIRTHVTAWSTGVGADVVPLPSNTTEGAAA